jgi:hypothetical protein
MSNKTGKTTVCQKEKKYKKKIESAEMKFLRSVAGYTLLDQKLNTDIRSELKIFNLTERITN